MPYYSSHTSQGRLVNTLRYVLDAKNLSSFKLSSLASLSPTTTRKIYSDENYIPSPDVLERICIVLDVQPGDLLQIASIMGSGLVVASGV